MKCTFAVWLGVFGFVWSVSIVYYSCAVCKYFTVCECASSAISCSSV